MNNDFGCSNIIYQMMHDKPTTRLLTAIRKLGPTRVQFGDAFILSVTSVTNPVAWSLDGKKTSEHKILMAAGTSRIINRCNLDRI